MAINDPTQPPGQGQGVSTDPSALQFMIQNGDVHQLEQQMADEQEPQDNPMEEQQDQQPPDTIISYDDAIDAVLKLILNHAGKDLDIQIQAKAIQELANAVKTLQEASIPQIDPQAQMELQYQQQEQQNKQSDQQMTMQQQLHEQALQHKQQLHEQQLKHNDANQALKEWQAQNLQNQQAEKHDQQTAQNVMTMDQKQQLHDQTIKNNEQNLSTPNPTA
jgi:hypothetical protein